MKTIKQIVLTTICIQLISCCVHSGEVFLKVIDEDGRPVKGASVDAGYKTLGGSPVHEIENDKNGQTDRDGFWIYSEIDYAKMVSGFGAGATKEGFYPTRAQTIDMRSIKQGLYSNSTNPIVIPLKKKVCPIPMYAKEAQPKLPAAEGSFGYDLITGDLVAPFGKGMISDFVFHISPVSTTNSLRRAGPDWTIDITFSNKTDGLQPFFVKHRNAPQSQLTSSHNAPPTGYYSSLKEADGNWMKQYNDPEYRKAERYWSEEIHYYFRVRSKADGSAMYGIIGGFFRVYRWGDDVVPHIMFYYLLNPDGTRNVEYDSKRNLFTQSSTQQNGKRPVIGW